MKRGRFTLCRLARWTHRLDFHIERDQAFGNDENVVAQALGHDVEVPAGRCRLLTDFLAEPCLNSRQPVVDSRNPLVNGSKICADNLEGVAPSRRPCGR
jgi:hypothetical protein